MTLIVSSKDVPDGEKRVHIVTFTKRLCRNLMDVKEERVFVIDYYMLQQMLQISPLICTIT